jgi:hypothetical protein
MPARDVTYGSRCYTVKILTLLFQVRSLGGLLSVGLDSDTNVEEVSY